METAWRDLADALGPARVLLVRDPDTGLEAFVVVDNLALGPAIGGVRMAPDVTVGEVARLARAMTLKNAAAGLPHGGGKAGIVADPRLPRADKERLVRSFARAIRDAVEYIPGPDMGTDETCMAWVFDEIGRAVGLPEVLGGIPLDRIGATGYGLAVAAEAAAAAGLIVLEGARVAVQGYGSVGRAAARFLAERKARVVAVADSSGGTADPDGLELEKLEARKAEGNPVVTFPDAAPITHEQLVEVDCDVWVPAARPDVIDAANVGRLRARLVLEGANIPVTPEAEALLHERGVTVIPDFIANAGGVICAATELHGGTRAQAFAAIAEKIRANTAAVLQRVAEAGITPREAAEALARERVAEAATYRRH
jgi:glutamate dehydrogenase/leucine dehydrogenase